MIENLITDSKMQDKYLEKIKNQLIVDTRVFHYFIENNDEKKADIVKKRIEIATDEIKELEELMEQFVRTKDVDIYTRFYYGSHFI